MVDSFEIVSSIDRIAVVISSVVYKTRGSEISKIHVFENIGLGSVKFAHDFGLWVHLFWIMSFRDVYNEI